METDGRRTLTPLLAAVLLISLRSGAGAQPPTSSKCSSAEHRSLDFWVGDWDAYDVGGGDKPSARVRVDVILDGCALREVYEGADGLAGESFTIYDASRKLWHQTWVTNRGQLLEIEGRFQGSSLTLQGPRISPEGREEIVRGVWTREDGGVRETAHTSADRGATWRPWFDILFRRHGGGSATSDTSETDRSAMETLTRLNQEYVDAFMKADVDWYRDHLADDFVCIDSSGTVLDKEAFLRDTAGGPGVTAYKLEEVRVRMFGPFALVHARGAFTRPDGTAGTSRYTDVWALQDGKWKTVAAQITRIPSSTR
jgi:ketosteroid isomerase-like protein